MGVYFTSEKENNHIGHYYHKKYIRKENTHMSEVDASIKRKTKAEPKLMQYIDIHTSYPYTNVFSKKEIIHVPVIEVEIFSTDKNIVEKIFEYFVKALKNKIENKTMKNKT